MRSRYMSHRPYDTQPQHCALPVFGWRCRAGAAALPPGQRLLQLMRRGVRGLPAPMRQWLPAYRTRSGGTMRAHHRDRDLETVRD